MTLSLNLIEKVQDALNEIGFKRLISFSGGSRHIRMKCPPGFKLVNKTCQRMQSSELLSRRRAAKKAGRTRRSQLSQINRKRSLTLRRRHSAGL